MNNTHTIKNKKKIRCHLTDFWTDKLSDIDWLFELFVPGYEIVWDDQNPDYLFFSCFGKEHLRYPECVKIFYGTENVEPDFNFSDYSVSLSPIVSGDRAYRFYNQSLLRHNIREIPENPARRKFCNFVYSNSTLADPFREHIFHRLSEYKKVDSGGLFLNNIGGQVTDKSHFISQYKFTFSVENSSLPGYSTEKIIDPFLYRSVPLYWGNPDIEKDYNPAAFVNLMNYDSIDRAIEEIIRLDNDDAAYLEMLNTPFWTYGDTLEEFKEKELARLHAFMDHIFDQPLYKARRRTLYGWNRLNTYNTVQCSLPLKSCVLKVGKRIMRSVIR